LTIKKQIALNAGLVALVSLSLACAPDQQTADRPPGTGADTTRPATTAGTAGMMNADAQRFVREASMGNHAEIQLSQLAVQRAQNQDVREFAQRMIDDHTRAQNQLEQAVRQADLEMPRELGPQHQQIEQRLSGLTGNAFDREYIDVMVQEHQETIELLSERADMQGTHAAQGTQRTQGTQGMQADGQQRAVPAGPQPAPADHGAGMAGQDAHGVERALDRWASETLPTIQQHLEHAQKLQRQLGGREQTEE
jgi:putative membrane protein